MNLIIEDVYKQKKKILIIIIRKYWIKYFYLEKIRIYNLTSERINISMETSKMKNMVVLKNLPSNMIEEAIVIFKENSKIKAKDVINKSNQLSQVQGKSKDIIFKEAEMLVNDYVKRVESSKNRKIFDKKINDKFLKKYSVVITILFIISLTINFI